MAVYGASHHGAASHTPHLAVAAIDFGSTYSGYAFSLTTHPEQIKCYTKWGTVCGIASTYKTPSCVLLDRNNQLVEFGYEAVNKFSELDEEEQKDYALFENFKMELYRSKNPENVKCRSSQQNRECPLMALVAMSLKYLKERMLIHLEESTNQSVDAKDIRWVVTVPAIWDDRAKNFMRKASEKAGLVDKSRPDRFLFALEPEAAAVYCQQVEVNLPTSPRSSESMKMTPGTRFLVVDAGGGTLDITAQEVLDSERMSVLHCANGDALGGALVDEKIIALVTSIIGEGVMNRHKTQCYADYKAMTNNIEIAKKTVGKFQSKSVNVGLSMAFNETYDDVTGNDLSECVGRYWQEKGIKYTNGFLKLTIAKVLEAFEAVVKSIVEMIGNILLSPELNGVSHIIMVGGFSESQVLQNAVKQKFSSMYKFVIPNETSAAVVKGAVLYGHRTEVIQARRAVKTYAVSDWGRYVEGVHDAKRRVKADDGQLLVKRCAHVLVKKGELVNLDSVQTVIVTPVYSGQTNIPVELYCTEKLAPLYVDEADVKQLANLRVPLPGSGMDREIQVNFRFGGTEMDVEAVDSSGGQPVKVAVEFLAEPVGGSS